MKWIRLFNEDDKQKNVKVHSPKFKVGDIVYSVHKPGEIITLQGKDMVDEWNNPHPYIIDKVREWSRGRFGYHFQGESDYTWTDEDHLSYKKPQHRKKVKWPGGVGTLDVEVIDG